MCVHVCVGVRVQVHTHNRETFVLLQTKNGCYDAIMLMVIFPIEEDYPLSIFGLSCSFIDDFSLYHITYVFMPENAQRELGAIHLLTPFNKQELETTWFCGLNRNIWLPSF